ncbi:MAG: hypothetical protein PHN94_07550 [Bacteroidales bacterium]|nr:hypothetical protein [Bacteroidales bacterium]
MNLNSPEATVAADHSPFALRPSPRADVSRSCGRSKVGDMESKPIEIQLITQSTHPHISTSSHQHISLCI